MSKAGLRKKIIKDREGLSSEYVRKKSLEICSNVMSMDKYIFAESLMLYRSIRNEVDLSIIFNHSLSMGKRIFFPRVTGNYINAYEAKSVDDFEIGAYGILEPKRLSKEISPNEIELIIVPGVAFDKLGYRLGYGGGFYDKFLLGTLSPIVGVCYPFQILDSVLKEDHDVKVDFLVSI